MLTQKQSQWLDYLRIYFIKAGRMPTLQEIADQFHIANRGTVSRYLNTLVEKGYLKRIPGQRGYVLVEMEADPRFSLPLAGQIAAGRPIEAIEGQDRIDLYDYLLGPDRFVLKVKGDSMIEAGIFDGDFVVIQKQEDATTGDIVVALIDEQEATLKRFEQTHDQQVILHPENAAMQSLRYPASRVRIQGKLVAQLRAYP